MKYLELDHFIPKYPQTTTYGSRELTYSQYTVWFHLYMFLICAQVITSIISCGMKLFIHL